MNINSDIVTTRFQDVGFDELLEDLTKEVEFKNYLITRIVNVDNIKERQKLVKDIKIGFTRYKILEFCNLMNCNEVVSSDLRAGVFMPVRFAVYQPLGENAVYVSYLKPTALARLFGSKRMIKATKQLEEDMSDVVEETGF